MISCGACPLRQVNAFRRLPSEQVAFIQSMKRGERDYAAGDTVLKQGARNAELFTVLDGWAFRYKTLEDGSRQILNFLLPGDLIGLQKQMDGESQHGVEALTAMRACVLDGTRLWSLYTNFPDLAHDVTWLACTEQSIVDENLLSVGQRSSVRRVAALFYVLQMRIKDLSLGQPLLLPLAQQHVADSLGLSLVHTQRTLRSMRNRRLIDTSRGAVQVLDEAELGRLAGATAGPRAARALL
jgi:CRP-like cAMP-binding protein